MKKTTIIFLSLCLFVSTFILVGQLKQVFTSHKTCEFIVNEDIQSIQKTLLFNDITSQIVKHQGGEIINSKLSGVDFKIPLKDLRLKQIKEFTVKTKHGNFPIRQSIEMQSNKIISQFVLSEPNDLVDLYENEIIISKINDNNTQINISVKIKIKEKSLFKYRVQSKLDEAAESSINSCKYILEKTL